MECLDVYLRMCGPWHFVFALALVVCAFWMGVFSNLLYLPLGNLPQIMLHCCDLSFPHYFWVRKHALLCVFLQQQITVNFVINQRILKYEKLIIVARTQKWMSLNNNLLLYCVIIILILLLFTGSGSCRFSYSDPNIIVSYSKNNSTYWIQLEKIRSVLIALLANYCPFFK